MVRGEETNGSTCRIEDMKTATGKLRECINAKVEKKSGVFISEYLTINRSCLKSLYM